jgi:hypothetical protein
MTTGAPSLISILNLRSIPCNQYIPKNIGYTAWGIQVGSYLDDCPDRSDKSTLEEQMVNSFIMMTKHVLHVLS